MPTVDDDAVVEDESEYTETVHPEEFPKNTTPPVLMNVFYLVINVIQTYGWFIVFGLILLFIMRKRILSYLDDLYTRRQQQQDLHRYDTNEAFRRQEAMDAARRKLQEAYDVQTAIYAAEKQKKDDEKRKELLADWDRHQDGKGYKSKYKPPPTNDALSPPVLPKKKTVYRQSDYNPLTGTSGSAGSYRRPTTSRGGAGGGG
jgi:hypothetical protein